MSLLKSGLKVAYLLTFAFLLIAVDARAQDPGPQFEEYLSGLTREGRFTGSVLVSREGKVIYSKGFGMANRELDVPNTPQTKFRLGSITKQFTAVSIMLLQERGKLRVEDPVCKYVESCPEAWKDVTIHHLLTHTGGVPSFTGFPEYQKTMMIPVTMESLLDRFRNKPLEFKPGEKFNYSNSGYVLLGYLIEKVAGETYESFLKKNIFEPLGMNDSGYDRHESILKNRATGYSENCTGGLNSSVIDMTIPHAAGALYSTVGDLFKWNEALFSDKLISANSRQTMTTPVRNNYGYGLTMNKAVKRDIVAHGGGINGFSTFLVRYPAEKITIAVLRNADFGNPNPGKVAQDLASIMFGEKFQNPPVQPVAKVDPKLFDAYVGQYEVAPNFIITVRKEGVCLKAQATNQPEFDIFPEAENKFFLKVIPAKMTFVKDDKGEVTQMILHQGGDKPAKKIK